MINPAAENQGTWIDIPVLAALKGCSVQGALKWALKNADTRKILWKGRGGYKNQVRLESLDLILQRKYFSQDSGISSAIAAPAENLPAPTEQKANIVRMDFTPKVKKEELPAKEGKPRQLRPWQDKRARASYALAMAVTDAKKRVAHSMKMKAAKDFLRLYNNGFLMQEVFKELGPVKYKTLDGWLGNLKKANGDYRALAPAHGDKTFGKFGLSELEREVLLRCALKPYAPAIGTAIRDMKAILRDRSINSRSSAAQCRRFLENYRDQNYHIWVFAREGEKAFDDKAAPYVERDASQLEVGEILIADGHPINFFVLNPWTGKPARASLVLWLDWASRYSCGYEIMLTENVQAISSALRRAIITLGKYPRHGLLDNGRAFKAKVFTGDVCLEEEAAIYSRIGMSVRFARAYNAKDKPIERFFETFGHWVEEKLPSYCGSSIGKKPPYMKRNEKFHKAIHNPFVPTLEQAMELVRIGLEKLYINEVHSGLNGRTPREVFEAGKGPGVDIEELNFLMMHSQVRTVGRNGVNILGSHYYNEALFGYRGHVTVYYDVERLSQVHLYEENGKYLCMAERVRKIDPLLRGKDDLEAVKQNAKLRAQAKKAIRTAVKAVNGIPQRIDDEIVAGIDWQPALEAMPNLPEVIEAAQADVAEASADQSIGQSEHPFFEYAWKKYDWLMGKETLTADEQEWVTEYRAGIIEPGEFQALYGQEPRGGFQAAQ